MQSAFRAARFVEVRLEFLGGQPRYEFVPHHCPSTFALGSSAPEKVRVLPWMLPRASAVLCTPAAPAAVWSWLPRLSPVMLAIAALAILVICASPSSPPNAPPLTGFSCGLKMHLCRPPPPSPLPPMLAPPMSTPGAPPAPRVWRRYEFAGGGDGRWTWQDYPPQVCPIDGLVIFYWDAPHDLVRLPSAQALEACELGEAEILAPVSDVGEYHLHCTEGETYHLTCSLPGHCEAGQKLEVSTSGSGVAAFDADGAALLHVASFGRLMTVLGFKAEDDGSARLTRGFSTEAVANSTLELLWCLLPHCANCAGGPGGAALGGACPSDDWEGEDATNASCAADVYTYAGYDLASCWVILLRASDSRIELRPCWPAWMSRHRVAGRASAGAHASRAVPAGPRRTR